MLWIKEGIHEGFYTVVSVDSQTQITTNAAANFTSTTSLTYEIWTATIFKGRIVDKNFEKIKVVLCEDECESDIDKLIEADYYCGRLGGIVQDILDNECGFITHPYTKASPYNYRAPHNFRNEPDGAWAGDDYFQSVATTGNGAVSIVASNAGHKKLLTQSAGSLGTSTIVATKPAPEKTGIIEFYACSSSSTNYWQISLNDHGTLPATGACLRFYTNGWIEYLNSAGVGISIQSYSANVMYKIKIQWDVEDKWHLWINDVLKSGSGFFWYTSCPGGVTHYTMRQNNAYRSFYIDAFGCNNDQNYIVGSNVNTEYDELIYTTEFFKIQMTEKTPRQYFNAYALKHTKTWYLDPDYLIHINDGDKDSLIDIDASSNVDNVDGKKQIKAIDKVVLKGGMVNGERLIATYGSGNVLAKDTYAHILDQDDLNDMALKVYNQQSAGILKIALDFEDPDIGYIQIAEELTIVGNTIRFKKSDDYICTTNTQFKLSSERLQLGPYGKILHNELYLDDVLLFQISESEGTQKATEENAELISEVGSGVGSPGGGGEVNTGFNVGTDGEGVYNGKSGVTLQFRNVAPASNKITVVLNGNDIDLNVDESNFDQSYAVAAINAAGLILATSKIYNSENENSIHYIGRAQLGLASDNLYLGYRGFDATKFALRQSSAHTNTYLNANTQIWFQIASNNKANINVDGLQLVTDARITEFDNGVLVDSATKVPTSAAVFAALHARSHAITSPSDHTANAWKILYTNADGDIIELALGDDEDVLTSQGAAVAPAFAPPGGSGAVDKTRTIAMKCLPNNGAVNAAYGIDMDADTEGWSMGVKLPSNVDTSNDVKIIYSWKCQADNLHANLERWVSAIKTDGSEIHSWNIVSAQQYFARGDTAETTNYVYTETYTIAAAAIDVGDTILMLIRSNEGALDQLIYSAELEYEVV